MKIKRYRYSGPFAVTAIGPGRLHITARAPAVAELYVRLDGVARLEGGARLDRTEPLDGAAGRPYPSNGTTLEVEWNADGVALSFDAGPPYRVRSALVHEPSTGLYGELPLATFDARARRFWRRVFWLLRIPGGRWLLDSIARRKR